MKSIPKFTKSFTQQEEIPSDAIQAAIAVMSHGRLHRYNVANGEVSETARLETDFADSIGAKYCLAVASGGYAISCALKAVGVDKNANVLSNAFTLAPVPGAIVGIGANPILVESAFDLKIDLNDLEKKAKASKSRFLVLSHMRGHICDMKKILEICSKHQLTLIEDCAHTMGAFWDKTPSGKFGHISCFSTQTYKHINSGEGGLITTDCPETIARAIILSGSYMLYDKHLSRPSVEEFEEIKLNYPNCSGRMDNLRAAILRPQLARLKGQCKKWNERYRVIEKKLKGLSTITTIQRPQEEKYVGSSIQFFIPSEDPDLPKRFILSCREQGVELKWFGDRVPKGYTSRFDSWLYLSQQDCPKTKKILKNLYDMRIPLTFTTADCEMIGEIIFDVASKVN